MGPNAVLLINLLLGGLDRLLAYKATLDKANAEGRDVTEGELDALRAADDAARIRLKDAIDHSPGGN